MSERGHAAFDFPGCPGVVLHIVVFELPVAELKVNLKVGVVLRPAGELEF